MTDTIKYIPPLISGNRLEEYNDYHNTLSETNLDVGGYIRISTKKDSQLTSIENQKKYLKEWANINGYNIIRFYSDVKSGAYSYLRNEMKQLREDIKNGKIKGIVSKEISRTSRDIMDVIDLKRNLAASGAFFISIKENYDSRTDDDEFLLIIHAGLAQKERKTTASRVKITQMLKAKEGKTNVPSPAFGYKLSEDKQHLVIDPEKSKIYEFIVEKYLEGWGQLKICKHLNQQGIPAKRSSKWHTNSIRTILTNPVYLGITIYNATTLIRNSEGKRRRVMRPKSEWIVRYNTHSPLITEDEFNKIQTLLNERRKKCTKEWSCEKKYLLSGLLHCEVCKGKIYGSKQVSKNRKNSVTGETYVSYSYVDQNRYGICDTKTKYWNMGKVDNLVLEEIKKIFRDKTLLEEQIKSKQYLFNSNLKSFKEQHDKLFEKLDRVNNAIKRQQEAYELEAISVEEYRTRMSELREQKRQLLLRLEAINLKLESVDSFEEQFKEIRDKVVDIIENINKMDYSFKVSLIKKLIHRIFIKHDYSIKIEYTFE
jgi:site-specific DNA recombinase